MCEFFFQMRTESVNNFTDDGAVAQRLSNLPEITQLASSRTKM